MLVLDSLSFGASYHSSSKIKVEGTLDDGTGTLQSKRLSDNVTATLELPWRLQLGVRHQTTEKLAIEFDFTRTGWKTFDTLDIKNKEYRKTLSTSINNFDNANAYRLGVTYDFSQATQLRVGYTYDETPQKDERFSIRIPDADRQLFSLGIGHTLSNNWTLEAGYMYVKFDDRTIDSPTTAVAGQEANGTTAVNGTYISNVQLFGFGISKTFM
jgi:long-chain fatty acid transport protein